MRRMRLVAGMVAVCASAWMSASYAIVGVGVHWGIDFSLSMEDKFKETMDDFQLTLGVNDLPFLNQSQIPSTLSAQLNTTLTGDDIPFYVDRFNWNNGNGRMNPIAFGGKVFVDIIPVIDAIEASFDFAMWEYDGRLIFPVGMSAAPQNATTIPELFSYDTLNLTLAEAGMPSVMGLLDGTPYLKMHIDLTVRKNLVAVPKKMKIFRLYLGGGLNLNIGTPVLSSGLIQDAMRTAFDSTGAMLSALSATDPTQLALNQQDLQKAVMNQIMQNINKFKFGAHIIAGTMIKLPVIPIGFYVDGKLMIPFGELDEYVDIGGFGFLVDGGIAFAL